MIDSTCPAPQTIPLYKHYLSFNEFKIRSNENCKCNNVPIIYCCYYHHHYH